jgi:hypothetical protein
MALPNYNNRRRHGGDNPGKGRRKARRWNAANPPPNAMGTAVTQPTAPSTPDAEQTWLPGQSGYPGYQAPAAGTQASQTTQAVDWSAPVGQAQQTGAAPTAVQQTQAATAQPTPSATSGGSAIYQPPNQSNIPSNLPQYTEDHPFFDPNSNYWQPGVGQSNPSGIFNQPDTELWRQWSNQNPEGFYYGMLNRQGLGGFDARSQTAQGLYREAMTGYEAAKQNNAELDVADYLRNYDVQNILRRMTNEQLGIDTPRYRARNRWGQRAV